MVVEITKEAFNAIVVNEQNSFISNNITELAESTIFQSKGIKLQTIQNFIGNIKQYYLYDINS
jgi:hypothetical protein